MPEEVLTAEKVDENAFAHEVSLLAAVSNTSPCPTSIGYRIGAIDWLEKVFGEVWVPSAVASELEEGRNIGYDVPSQRILALTGESSS